MTRGCGEQHARQVRNIVKRLESDDTRISMVAAVSAQLRHLHAELTGYIEDGGYESKSFGTMTREEAENLRASIKPFCRSEHLWTTISNGAPKDAKAKGKASKAA